MEPETEIIYDTDFKTLIFEDKHSRALITQKHMPFKTELEPWYSFIPSSWGSGQRYIISWGINFSCGIGVNIFAKLTVNGEVWWLPRDRLSIESGRLHYAFLNHRRMPNHPLRVKIELGRRVNGEDIVDVIYEGSTTPNGKSGFGPGYPVKILTWESRIEITEGQPIGVWFMLMRRAEYEVPVYLVLRDLDSDEILMKRTSTEKQENPLFNAGLILPKGEHHLRFSIESLAGEVYDYFDTTVTINAITPPPPSTSWMLPALMGSLLAALIGIYIFKEN